MVFAVGCGGGGGKGGKGLDVKGGDKLYATETLDRVRFEASYGENAKSPDYTEGDFITIPNGTVLEVYVTPKSGVSIIEVVPVKLGEKTNPDEIRDELINARFLKTTPLYYTISIPIEYYGTKVKKVE
jgi:hypothetical protein